MYCIAHRGASGVAPENTMWAFWTAIVSGADIIELDVQITKDSQLVIFHDRSLDRITGDSGGIADYTLAELNEKDVGKWKNQEFTGVKIPTFEQVLQELPEDCSIIVEVKPQNKVVEKDRTLEKKIVVLLDKYRGVGTGYISVRDEATWEWFRDNAPRYPCGMMQKKRSASEFLDIVENYNLPFAQIRWRNYSDDDFLKLRKTGTKIIVFYADIPSEWDFLISKQVDGILTNYPSLLKGYILGKSEFK